MHVFSVDRESEFVYILSSFRRVHSFCSIVLACEKNLCITVCYTYCNTHYTLNKTRLAKKCHLVIVGIQYSFCVENLKNNKYEFRIIFPCSIYIQYVYGYLKYVQELCDYFTHLYLQIVHNLCRHGKCYSKLIIYSTGLPAFLLVCLSRSDLSACLPASVPVCLSCILLSVSLSTCLPFLLSRHLSLSACFVSACLSFCLSSFVSLQLSTCLSACLSLFINPNVNTVQVKLK